MKLASIRIICVVHKRFLRFNRWNMINPEQNNH